MFRRWLPAGLLPAVFISAAGLAACDADPRESPFTPQPDPVPTLTALAIQGNTELTSVGEISQLRAIASWSDGRTTDVTNESAWSVSGRPNAFGSLAAGVASVSLSGLLETRALGMAYVRARYGLGRAERAIRVTPPGTFVVAGRVRQPGASVLRGVTITEPISGRSTISGDEGEFMLAALTASALTLTKSLFEPVSATVRPFDDEVDLPMQPLYGISAGGSVSGMIAPNDLSYEVRSGVTCGVCRMIRVTSAVAGRLTVTVKWNLAPTRLTIWAGADEFPPAPGSVELVATFPVTAGETKVYVGAGAATAHTAFEVTTTLTPS